LITDSLLQSYIDQLNDLSAIVHESNARVLNVPPDALFNEYLNVFVKAYLVSACSILEAFVGDGAFSCLSSFKERVSAARIPHNLIEWEVIVDEKKKKDISGYFVIKKDRKAINENVSGNYYKTKEIFRKLGINLDSDETFKSFADSISATINKRNSIVHHNDDASDISLPDVLEKIIEFKAYISCIQRVVNESESASAAT